MGMSASQARLIALTGRKNDIEYQGQQINQQRTTLASQINALYNSLLEMDVPTPPSTLDYKKTVYTGTNNATRFSVGTVTPTGDNSYTIDLSYKMSGHSFEQSNTVAKLSPASEYLYYNEVSSTSFMNSHTDKGYEVPAEALNKDNFEALLSADDSTDASKNDVLVKMTVADYNKFIKGKTGLGGDVYNVNSRNDQTLLQEVNDVSKLQETDSVYVRLNASDLQDPTNKDLAAYCGITFTESTDDSGNPVTTPNYDNIQNVYSADVKNKEVEYYEGYITDQQVAARGYYIIEDGKEIQITTAEDLKNYVENQKLTIYQKTTDGDSASKKIKNPAYDSNSSTQLQVGSMPVYNLSDKEAEKQLAVSMSDYIEGIKHSFPEFANLSDDEIKAKFYVYFEPGINGASTKAHLIKIDEIGVVDTDNKTVKSYEYDAAGTYTQSKPTAGCELEFDNSGRISRIGIPDSNGQITYVDVEFTTETDEEAYQDAMVQYEYKKYKYDQEQQEINAKTSIIQAEDKNLELKLTRLDNERKAVDTELDAVKKVVEDNISKSFKTFNG